MIRDIDSLLRGVRGAFAWKRTSDSSEGFIFFEAITSAVILSIFFLGLLRFSMNTMLHVEQLYAKDRGLQMAVSRMEEIRADYINTGRLPGSAEELTDGFLLSVVQSEQPLGNQVYTRVKVRCSRGDMEICDLDTLLLPLEWRKRMYAYQKVEEPPPAEQPAGERTVQPAAEQPAGERATAMQRPATAEQPAADQP